MTSRWHNDFKSTHNGKAPAKTDLNAKRKPRLLSDDHIEALREFADDGPALLGYYPDSKVFWPDYLSRHEVYSLALPSAEPIQGQAIIRLQNAWQLACDGRR